MVGFWAESAAMVEVDMAGIGNRLWLGQVGD
jgi:hypothetical protein